MRKLSWFSKSLISGLLLATFILTSENAILPPVDIANSLAPNSSTSVAQPYSDRIGWRIKEEDGKYYKRLYNYSTGDWIGDWIYIGDVP